MFGDKLVIKDGLQIGLGCGHTQLLLAIKNGQFAGARQVLCPDCGQWITTNEAAPEVPVEAPPAVRTRVRG